VAIPASDTGDAVASTALLPIRNARVPLAGVLSGGQPTPEQIESASRAGFRTVINLRSEQEQGFEWEAEAVEELGMRYVWIPVAGKDGLSHDNVGRLDAALGEALERGPVLLHCASGNRIGAMLALRARWLQDTPADEALDFGLANGLTSLRETTESLLDAPAPDPDPAAAPLE
jgi:uncharacterized protein (TIGR01244 family)